MTRVLNLCDKGYSFSFKSRLIKGLSHDYTCGSASPAKCLLSILLEDNQDYREGSALQ